MQRQINNYIINHLFPYLCRYGKDLDNKGFGGVVLMKLWKAFGTLNHELLIAKLLAYGLNREQQRAKIYKSSSSCAELKQGATQGSILGPLLINIYLNDLFYLAESTEVCNSAYDTTYI